MRYSFALVSFAILILGGVWYVTGRTQAAVVHDVPFFSQAPLNNWFDSRQQYGCEEASLLMAYSWARGQTYTLAEAEQYIIGMAEFERYFWGFHHDTGAADTARLYREFFGESSVRVVYDVRDEDMVRQLDSGNVVLVPVNASMLQSDRSPRGPIRHMVLVLGYDGNSEEFIVHDPLLHSGYHLRYPRKMLEASLRDYPSGFNEPIREHRSAMIVIGR